MTEAGSRLVCGGCGASPSPTDPYPFRCPNGGRSDTDHVLAKVLPPAAVVFPAGGDDAEPFIRYRTLLHSYHRARAGGVSDAEFVDLVGRLDAQVARVDGRGFEPTPFGRSPDISDRLGFGPEGGVWIKDETGNVAGSHKARHLMGILLHLEVSERLGLADPGERPDLAIASCGNAALAAAVVAAAGGRRLRVFVPVDADPVIVARLVDLGADVARCPRQAGVPGDPAYLALLEEIRRGALPFTVQGNLNGVAVEGGDTLGYEIATELAAAGLEADHLVVQVGGGALASSCAESFAEAHDLGVLRRRPRLHTVQTAGAHPLERAYRRVRAALPVDPDPSLIAEALRRAADRRSDYMWPWETEPKSMATGILDDETYDWLAVVRGMLLTGGRPVIATEEQLEQAHQLGRLAAFPVDPTGTSGLAGLLDLLDRGVVEPGDNVVVLFTGVEREPTGSPKAIDQAG